MEDTERTRQKQTEINRNEVPLDEVIELYQDVREIEERMRMVVRESFLKDGREKYKKIYEKKTKMLKRKGIKPKVFKSNKEKTELVNSFFKKKGIH